MNKYLRAIIKRSNTILQNIMYDIDFRINNPTNRLISDFQNLFRKNGMNFCFNRYIQRDYDPAKKNILIAIESPAVVKYEKWLKPEMKFVAEISFANYYNLKNFYCPRELYAPNDFYVHLNTSKKYDKDRLISMIYSGSKHLEGHKLRHKIGDNFKNQIEMFGSGSIELKEDNKNLFYPNSKYVKKIISLEKYMFQIVIENGKFPEYVSEKFYDCLKTRTIPIYWGGEKAVKKMGFDTEGILFFDTIEDFEKIIEEKVTESNYKSLNQALEYNFNRLIEIRNKLKFSFFLNGFMSSYFHTIYSYHGRDYTAMSLDLD